MLHKGQEISSLCYQISGLNKDFFFSKNHGQQREKEVICMMFVLELSLSLAVLDFTDANPWNFSKVNIISQNKLKGSCEPALKTAYYGHQTPFQNLQKPVRFNEIVANKPARQSEMTSDNTAAPAC